ncbi:MAG TPA: glycoside hydrolase family 43 protein [Acidimicrobiales bacterium]|nr:glycoside hydrolase family 43 protein [Acidimicrobiales bacterium]
MALVLVLAVSLGVAQGLGQRRAFPPRACGLPACRPAPGPTLPPPADGPAAAARIVTPGMDVPNPFMLVGGGRYFLYSSQWGFYKPNVPVRESTRRDVWRAAPGDQWQGATEAMPRLPAWVRAGFTWAPDVRKVGGRYVMWFTGWLAGREPRTECIGVATSSSPLGPFVGLPQPSICQLDRHGSIDPRTFVDANGKEWLYWKSDDNADVGGTQRTSIYAQPLAPDGMTLTGSPVQILQADQAWEGRIVEAPQMVLAHGQYWLFYSGNWFNQPYYAIGVARCASAAGPCTKPFDHPWLASNPEGSGPGEQSLFSDSEGTWIIYSPWSVVYPHTDTPRPVAMARVGFGPDGPYLASW